MEKTKIKKEDAIYARLMFRLFSDTKLFLKTTTSKSSYN